MCTLQLLLDYSQLPLVKCRMRYTCFNFFFILKFAATLAEGNVLVYGTKELDESKSTTSISLQNIGHDGQE